MEFGGASSLVLLLAVGLWVAYLVPSIVRRRTYQSTERNAARLQQTLRALAETAEGPSEAHAEVTHRGVAEQERRVKKAKQAAERAERRRQAAAEKALPTVRMPRNDEDRKRASSATRRGRLVTTTVMLIGLAACAGGAWFGMQTGNWWGVVAGAVVVLGAFAMLHQLSRVATAQRSAAERLAAYSASRDVAAPDAETAPQPRLAEPLADFAPAHRAPTPERVADDDAMPAGWTPQPLPKPLYLRASGDDEGPGGGGPQGPGGGHRPPAVDIEALRAAARASEQAIRDAHRQPGVATFGRIAVARTETDTESSWQDPSMSATQPVQFGALDEAVYVDAIEAPPGRLGSRPSRWASMGIVDESADARAADTAFARRRRRAS